MDIQPSAARTAARISLGGANDSTLDLLPAAVYVCDVLGRIVQYNRKAVELWGRAPDIEEGEERFCGAHRLFLEDGRPIPHDESPMAQVLRTGDEARDLAVQIERADGSRVWVLVNIAPIRDAHGSMSGAINSFQDITHRKLAEAEARESRQALAASERRWRELLEGLPAAIYTTDREGRLTFCNAAATDLWGRRPDLGRSYWCGALRLFWTDGRPMPHEECPMAVTLKTGKPCPGEAVLERPDGSLIPFAAHPVPLHDETGAMTGAVNMLVDISRHKEAEDRQALLINELNHRVKNTLATVQSLASQSLRHSGSAEAFRETFGARLMALSRAHDHLTGASWERAWLRPIVLQELEPHRIDDGGRIEIRGCDIELPPRAALTLSMAFHELATNAVKHGSLSSTDGRLLVEWSVSRDQERPGESIRLSWVEQGGPPVSPPARRGFGSRLIERSIVGELQGSVQFDFAREGLRCFISIPLPNRARCEG